MILFLVAIALLALSGVPGLFFDRRSNLGQVLSAFLAVAGNGLGLAATVAWFYLGEPGELALPWSVPGGEFRVAIERLKETIGEAGAGKAATAAMANLAEAIHGLVNHMRTEQQMIRDWADSQAEQQRDIKRLLERLGREDVHKV